MTSLIVKKMYLALIMNWYNISVKISTFYLLYMWKKTVTFKENLICIQWASILVIFHTKFEGFFVSCKKEIFLRKLWNIFPSFFFISSANCNKKSYLFFFFFLFISCDDCPLNIKSEKIPILYTRKLFKLVLDIK